MLPCLFCVLVPLRLEVYLLSFKRIDKYVSILPQYFIANISCKGEQ